jgi:hypothetical protein
MPLAFESLSHGTIAFGFFNIESDMLLLDRYFIFAEDFCNYTGKIAKKGGDEPYAACWPIQFIEAVEDIGDLMGAIDGVRFSGFIGELYRRFPFPRRNEDFKQNPKGSQTRSLVSGMIAKYAQPREISVAISPEGGEIEIGVFRFNRAQFQELIKYVWRGGHPRWKDEIKPGYVAGMRNNILQNHTGIFEGIVFEDF